MIEHFEEVFILGDLSPNLLAEESIAIAPQRLPLPAELRDEGSRAPVADVVSYVTQKRQRPGYALVLTKHDLFMPECRQLFGFADRRAGVAVISTARLGSTDHQVLSRRLHNEIAHEWGHLQGLDHCANPGCVMGPVTAAKELDNRGEVPCGRCPHARSLKQLLQKYLATVAALCFLALCTAGLNGVATLIAGPPLAMPFT